MIRPVESQVASGSSDGSLWYKDAVIYELHVRAFCDSDGDGVGDFRGLAGKLEYLRDLGVTALWLLPFCPTLLKDDGYDITDYTNVYPAYGTLDDFKAFLKAAHGCGLRVITELVVNHTSDQHPWFQRARLAPPGSRERDFYVWSDSPDRYKDARIIFSDSETSNWAWDSVAKAYYWHRFYSHQPDLNFDNPAVQQAVFEVLDFWLEMGVDGLRLDAVPYLFERDGGNCENLPETHAFLKSVRQHVDQRFENRLLLAEANQWPEDAAAYFGAGDECHMAFHFPLMPRLFMGIRMEDRFPITDILDQTPQIPNTAQWALFLRNHDELTLEMVTDEERDYMYRMYATDPRAKLNLGIRRRLAPLLGNDRRRIELMTALLFALRGTPVIYYGDELGMGDNIYLGDRNGVRTPMQWNADRNAGFSRANPQKLYLPIIYDPEYHYEAINVETELANPNSLLWWMRRLLKVRNQHRVFGRGTLEFLQPENRKILAFLRRDDSEQILMVANLSRSVQHAELDLSGFKGVTPFELFGHNKFPPIGEQPYSFTFGPHAFYWFALAPERVSVATEGRGGEAWTVQSDAGCWSGLLQDQPKSELEARLPAYLNRQAWFDPANRSIRSVEISEMIPVPDGRDAGGQMCGQIALAQVEFVEGEPQLYLLPLVLVAGADARHLMKELPQAVVTRIESIATGAVSILADGMADRRFCLALLESVERGRMLKGSRGELVTAMTRAFAALRGDSTVSLEPIITADSLEASSVVFGDRLVLKLFRRVESGRNPGPELGLFLTEKRFANSPQLAASLNYWPGKQELFSLASVQEYFPQAENTWDFTLQALGRYYERLMTERPVQAELSMSIGTMLAYADEPLPSFVPGLIGTYLEAARLIGKHTAELHCVLASDSAQPDFTPEPFSAARRRSIYQAMRSLLGENFGLLRRRLRRLPASIQSLSQQVLELEPKIIQHYQRLLTQDLTALRIRCHGDYHLGQLLHTGKDFIITNFEGEPVRSLNERRRKNTPLRDLAGMLRSFDYASQEALIELHSQGPVRADEIAGFEPWSRFWLFWVSVMFLKSYLELARQSIYLPKTETEIELLLSLFVLDKAVYELGYELNHRPEWVPIPLRGILSVMTPELVLEKGIHETKAQA